MKSTSLVIIFLIVAKICQAQVLIALLFGDKLNSDKLEFGITLGNSISTQTNFSDTKWRGRGWNVGLWFNVKLDKNGRWYAHPGAIPKSTLGFRYLPEYTTGDPKIDSVINSFNFDVQRKVNYIHVPLLARYRIFTLEKKEGKKQGRKQNFFIQGGPQISLRTKAEDIFTADLGEDNTVTFENDLKDEIRRFDVSISTGLVWKFGKALELDISYNQGFLDIDKDDVSGTNRNQWVMINVNIPIGAGKKEKAAEGTIEEKAPVEKEAKPKKEKKSKEKTQ